MLKGIKSEGVVLVFAALAVLFVFTGALAKMYRDQRMQRAESHYKAGQELAQAGRPAQAVEEYRAALIYAQDDNRYQLALARSLMDVGRLSEAESHLLDLHANDPDGALTDLMLARIAARQGRTDAAVTNYHQAIYGLWQDDPAKNRIQARFELIDLLTRTGQTKQARSEIDALADEAPNDTAIENRIGGLLLRYGSPQRAREIFQRVLSKEPRNAEAAFGAAEAAFAQGDYAAAANWYRRTLRLNPENGSARQHFEETSEVISLDPMLVDLSASERLKRSRTLVEKTAESLKACAGRSTDPTVQTLIARADAFLETRRGHREGDTPRAMALAQDIWHERKQACGPAPQSEEALDLLMAKVGK